MVGLAIKTLSSEAQDSYRAKFGIKCKCSLVLVEMIEVTAEGVRVVETSVLHEREAPRFIEDMARSIGRPDVELHRIELSPEPSHSESDRATRKDLN